MKLVLYNCAALTGFDRLGFAVNWENGNQSPCSMGAVPDKHKSVLPRIPLASTIKQRPDYRGFFYGCRTPGDTNARKLAARKNRRTKSCKRRLGALPCLAGQEGRWR